MLQPIDMSGLPPDVRAAGTEGARLYQAALGFERQLLAQLADQLATTAEPADEEDAGGGSSYARSLLPGALADGLLAAGGVGLAHELWLGMRNAGPALEASAAPGAAEEALR